MQSTSTSARLREGQIFARETLGSTLILNPMIHLGSLDEPEISLETHDLLEFLNRSASANLVVDLANGDYLGTSMLGAIIKLWKRVSQRGGRLALCNVSESVVQVLRVTKLQTVWPIYPSREQALSAVGG